jgi:hypothetical protein
MTDLIDARRSAAARVSDAAGPGQRLQSVCAAVRVSVTWLGTRKTLSREQTSEAAEPFGAAANSLSAAKRLLDTRDPSYRALTSIRGAAIGYWRGCSLPYPEPGVRLLRHDRVEPFEEQMRAFREQLREACECFAGRYEELKRAARNRLGRLYDAADYPVNPGALFALDWDYPSVEAPQYLMQLNPRLYEQEQARVRARFDEAVTLAEQAFVTEFGKLLSHLTERLGGTADGKPKAFRDSAVSSLGEFFSRFAALNVRSNDELDRIVESARRIVQGTSAQDLRDSVGLRASIATQLAAVRSSLEGLMVERPRRRIVRVAREVMS